MFLIPSSRNETDYVLEFFGVFVVDVVVFKCFFFFFFPPACWNAVRLITFQRDLMQFITALNNYSSVVAIS